MQRALTDASLKAEIRPSGQYAGKALLAHGRDARDDWHRRGLEVVAPARGTEPLNSAKGMADAYQTAAQSLTEQASKKLNDEQLVFRDNPLMEGLCRWPWC